MACSHTSCRTLRGFTFEWENIMKKHLFAVLASLTLAAAAHAATQPDTPLRDGQALAEFFTGYPDLGNKAQAEATRTMLQSLVAHAGPDAYIHIDARTQHDADTMNAWLKDCSFKGRVFNGSVSGAIANGDAVRNLRVFVAAGKGMERPYSVNVPASFVAETQQQVDPSFAPLTRSQIVWVAAVPYPASLNSAAELGRLRLLVGTWQDQLDNQFRIVAHTRSNADARAMDQLFADSHLREGVPARNGIADSVPSLANLEFRVTGAARN